ISSDDKYDQNRGDQANDQPGFQAARSNRGTKPLEARIRQLFYEPAHIRILKSRKDLSKTHANWFLLPYNEPRINKITMKTG
ncbi:MAG: hypothetical protein R6V84_18320, partial [Desulfobacterales bacterium]